MITRDCGGAVPRTQANANRTVRLGVIDYLNVAPVYAHILREMETEGAASRIEARAGVPAQMNLALAAGMVEVSNVSSFAFGQHAGDWLLLPRLSVAAHGRVDSVLLFSWQEDWRGLDGRTIALTDQSATSIELVRVLAAHR